MTCVSISAKTSATLPSISYSIVIDGHRSLFGFAKHWRLKSGFCIYNDPGLQQVSFWAEQRSRPFKRTYRLKDIGGSTFAEIECFSPPFSRASVAIHTEGRGLSIRESGAIGFVAIQFLGTKAKYTILNCGADVGRAEIGQLLDGVGLQVTIEGCDDGQSQMTLIGAGLVLISEFLRQLAAVADA